MATRVMALPPEAGDRNRQVDFLVATYAPIGREYRKTEQRRRILGLLGTSLLVALAASILLTDTSTYFGSTSDLGELHELRDELNAEISAASTTRQELERVRQASEEKNRQLEARIGEIRARLSELDVEREQLAKHSALLADTMTEVDARRHVLKQRRDPAEVLDEEIAAISAQRIALEKRWQQFEAQGELLATEIIAVNAQRRELEVQRQQMDRQQRQLQALIDRAIEIDDRRRSGPAADAEAEQTAYAGSDAVGDGDLDEMRGGISIGDNLEIALGISHTGTINGVEQFSNQLVIDDLNGDMSGLDLSNVNTTLIQNGDGNFASPDVIDSLSGGFGSIIQNSLDDQSIATSTVLDIGIGNVAGAAQGQLASQALTDSLNLSR